MDALRVLVTGGRGYDNVEAVEKALATLPQDAVLIHGAATGADSLAAEVWESWGRKTEPYPAKWQAPCRDSCNPEHRRQRGGTSICPAAGVYRNQEMLDSGVDLVVAFPGGNGTKDMIQRARAANVPVKTEGLVDIDLTPR